MHEKHTDHEKRCFQPGRCLHTSPRLRSTKGTRQRQRQRGNEQRGRVIPSPSPRFAGTVELGVEFFPAGTLTVIPHAGRRLFDAETAGRQDPYIVFKMQGKEVHPVQTKRTKTDTDGGTEPQWDGEMHVFDIVDHYQMDNRERWR